MTVFNDYAKYYNLLYREKDYKKETDYINQLIQAHLKHAMTILDLGCGTGKHDALLAGQGYKVNGIDMSETMIRMAKSLEIAGSLEFEVADARSFKSPALFDVVLSLFHVINYQQANESLLDFFRTAHSHLKPGGIFIFDSWYGPAVLSDRPLKKTKIIENDELKIVRNTIPEMDVNNNTTHVYFEVDIQNKLTKQVDRLTEKHSMRYLFYPEIELVAELTGFRFLKFSKWMEEANPDDSAWYVVCCLMKK